LIFRLAEIAGFIKCLNSATISLIDTIDAQNSEKKMWSLIRLIMILQIRVENMMKNAAKKADILRKNHVCF
jgi:uncharacterized protein YjcR